ncbi:type IV conjugative transfer system pilin TraA [Vibrio ouci]|uniref:Pilin n=1 Tax=Vibrio ouci TaxID=2499078 RepID=A0A4Y8W8V6_9VIBR|nr:type IV conjugative transfer system pilin TraA [Vibrio ouci]TFH89372.1 type IV conjugative transfer system pilin TraA [Vibrio ouci]
MPLIHQKYESRILFLSIAALLLLGFAFPSLATDLFAEGKATIKSTAGDDSAAEMAMLTAGALGAAVTGFATRNWFGAIGGFAGGMIFWEVIKPLVGLA